jgi:hypothetical protein
MSPGDLWIICQNLSVSKYQAAARFGRQFNCTGDFSKHYIINRLAGKLIFEQILVSFLHVDCSLALKMACARNLKALIIF